MDHSHMDHGDMDMGDGGAMMCNMNMLFTWSTENLCIVFESWRVTGTSSLLLSLVAVVALTAGYEAVREASRRYETRHAAMMAAIPRDGPSPTTERSSLLARQLGTSVAAEEQKGKIVKAALYGVQVFYSFFIMLLFMTYNGWIMFAVGVGAFVGYLMFSSASSTKSAACH